jgi:hypothetical protein
MTVQSGTQLMVVSQYSAVQIFAAGTPEKILDAIEAEAKKAAEGLDISTEAGRKAIASVAYKISRTKTYLDDQGKDLTADLKKQTGAIDAERKKFRDRLDALKDSIRKPLTDFEEADKARFAAHEYALVEIEGAGPYSLQNWQTLSVEAMRDRVREIESDTRDWQEFSARAAGAKTTALRLIAEAVQKREKYDADQAELARHRAEAIEREKQEREARIAAEAKAKAEAEAKAREEKSAREASEREAAIRREKEEAEQRERAAEQRWVDAEAKAKRDAEEAKAKAERDREAAVEAERQRATAEKKRLEDERLKREANQKHREKINEEAQLAIGRVCADAAVGEEIVRLIAKGEIPHVKIEY